MTAKRRKLSHAQRLASRIQELALTIKDSYPYNSEESSKAEEIWDLAHQLETLIESATTTASKHGE